MSLPNLNNSKEASRLAEDSKQGKNWKRWGPYLSERQWGTVREDYSPDGDSWDYFTHEHARRRAYRWGEDGLLGITDRECRLCLALALWNGKDPILKERLFGLTNKEGNHGEDVKECYYYLDSTPTHSYMKALYKYPQSEFPYDRLKDENKKRGKDQPEFELEDTGIFNDNRYFDIFVEYAKNSPNDILIKFTIANRGPDSATLHFLPTLWFRNTWIWGCKHEGCSIKPKITVLNDHTLQTEHETLEKFHFEIDGNAIGQPKFLFTENETNSLKLFNIENYTPFVKDAFHEYVVHGKTDAVNPQNIGTKASVYYKLEIPAGKEISLRFRLYSEKEIPQEIFGQSFEQIFSDRVREADEFYTNRLTVSITNEEKNIVRQSAAGLLWSKQFYNYIVEDWLNGDPDQPPPPESRKEGRNNGWTHVYCRDIISMPDKWEFPWFAAWDLAFHMIPFSKLDPVYAKDQLILFLREWYTHPNGHLPAYEYAFSDVNPPVHAWAAWRVYKMTGPKGNRDRVFLERVFQKLLINFTWWVNRKDLEGKNLFSGGFLGLDNIGIFDRSQPLPTGGYLEQADGTGWMAFFCATMLSMALELASQNPVYEDIASKFFEHFVSITDAMNSLGGTGLWDDTDGFYYDQLHTDGTKMPLKLRSMVGLLPLIAVEVLEEEKILKLHHFTKRMHWFLKHRPDLAESITYMECNNNPSHKHYLLAIPSRDRLIRALRYMLDENEFLSPFGLRALSRYHKDHPYVFYVNGEEYKVAYVPGESDSNLFGGNSNWRGPIWFPVNFLLVEALERYHHFYGDSLKVECPTGSGHMMNLKEVAREISSRLAKIFLPDKNGNRPCHGGAPRYATDPHWKNLVLFYEYFHGDTGRGVGASHQTGWTSLVSRFLIDPGLKKQS